MTEVFNASVFGFNIIPTGLLSLLILYWISMIIGVIDHHSIDAHFDAHIDPHFDVDGSADGAFHSILVFFNLGEIPVMLFLSFTFLFWWILTTALKLLFDFGTFFSGLILLPSCIVALLLTKSITSPFKKFFKELKGNSQPVQLVNKICKMLTDLEPGRIGQAEIATCGAPFLINVKCSEGVSLKKDDDAVIIVKESATGLYEVKQIKDIIHLK
jgi:hypothetical protein